MNDVHVLDTAHQSIDKSTHTHQNVPYQLRSKCKQMPIIRDISLSLEINDILRRQGIKEHSKLKPTMRALIHELTDSAKNDSLLEPAIAYEIYPIANIDHDRLCLEGNAALQGSLFSSVLSSAKELAVAVCTIGPKLEEKVTYYFATNEPVRGVLLDGIGSAAVDSLTQEVCKFMTHEASTRGYQASSPLSPGMHGFPISEQWQVFHLVPAEQIGVSLTSSGIMVPRKSVSMTIGLGLQMRTWTEAEVCAHCNLRGTCHYRINT